MLLLSVCMLPGTNSLVQNGLKMVNEEALVAFSMESLRRLVSIWVQANWQTDVCPKKTNAHCALWHGPGPVATGPDTCLFIH